MGLMSGMSINEIRFVAQVSSSEAARIKGGGAGGGGGSIHPNLNPMSRSVIPYCSPLTLSFTLLMCLLSHPFVHHH